MATNEIYVIDARQAARIKAVLDAYERGELRGASAGPRRQFDPWDYEFGKATATINGVTGIGAAPQSGTVALYTLGSTGDTTAMGRNVTAYNFSTVAVSTVQWVHLKRHERSGKYVIQGSYENQCIKPLVRVVLSTSINQATSSVSCKVTDQYGLGLSTSTTLSLRNLAISSNYLFAGSTGHAGYAMPWSSSDGQLTMLECT